MVRFRNMEVGRVIRRITSRRLMSLTDRLLRRHPAISKLSPLHHIRRTRITPYQTPLLGIRMHRPCTRLPALLQQLFQIYRIWPWLSRHCRHLLCSSFRAGRHHCRRAMVFPLRGYVHLPLRYRSRINTHYHHRRK